MKFKSAKMMLQIILLIMGTADLVMLFTRNEVPTTLVITTWMLLLIASMSDFLETFKLRKLAYPLIIIYDFVGLPILEKFVHNKTLIVGYALLGLIIAMIFLYNDLIITNKEKN